MQKILVILENGCTFTVECKNVTVKYSEISGKITSIKWEGCTKNRPFYIDVDKIVAVIHENIIQPEEM